MTRRGVYRRELRSITQGGTTAGMLRERNKEEERKGRMGGRGQWGRRERENGGSHAGSMTGLLRRGEESGGYDRRRVQIITIIIFPGNMAAERGWPPSIRVGGKREPRERERERVGGWKVARRRQGGLS